MEVDAPVNWIQSLSRAIDYFEGEARWAHNKKTAQMRGFLQQYS